MPDDVRKCVVFVGAKKLDGTYQMMGSAFFLGRDKADGKADPCYLVTARHVIDMARARGAETIGLRMNGKAGNAEWLDVPINEWVYLKADSAVDVAIREMGIPAWIDHLAVPYSIAATFDVLQENDVGPGDEVFVTGLFRHHQGANRNIPIIRIGNVACMGEEKVSTSLGEMDAMLIEARSIGGLSGSPVFLHLGHARPVKGQITLTSKMFLLGLIHGHYDASAHGIDGAVEDDAEPTDSVRLSTAQINTGIAIVVPFHTIDSVISLYEKRKAQPLTFSGDLEFEPFANL